MIPGAQVTRQPNEELTPETVDALREQLYVIRRSAISVVHVCENLLQLPQDKRAIRTRAERRTEVLDE